MIKKIIFDTITIIGPGLIGGSIGLGLKKNRLVKTVFGIGHNQSSITKAIESGAIDKGSLEIGEGLSDSDAVIISTPVSIIPKIFEKIIPYLKADTIITDVGSVKGFIASEFERLISRSVINKKEMPIFIGGHPIAGSEKRGVEYARPDLFIGSLCVLTPTNSDNEGRVKKLSSMWESLGSNVAIMSPEEHDTILAITSHLPQLAAFGIANLIKDDYWRFSGGGLKDMTRIASSDPNLWLDICEQNRNNVIYAIESFIKELLQFHTALKTDNKAELLTRFKKAKENRDKFYKNKTNLTF